MQHRQLYHLPEENRLYAVGLTLLLWAAFILIQRMCRRMKKELVNSSQEVVEDVEYLQAVFDAAAVGVVAVNKDHNVSYMNATSARMCGVLLEQAIGKPVAAVVRLARGSRRSDISSRLHDFRNKNSNLSSTFILRSHNRQRIHVQPIISKLTIRGKSKGTVILLKDVSASVRIMRKLVYSASYDHLTGLPNRSSFETCLQEAVNDLAENLSKHALVFLDLDGFKAINDSAGHAGGDVVLKQISRLLQMKLRHSDFLARLAGDEFGLILFNCELCHAKSLVSVLVENIRQYPFSWENAEFRVGASAGIVSVDSTDVGVAELLSRADAACYDAKRRGKGQVCVFGECSSLNQ